MGSKKSESSSKPIYSSQIEGAAKTLGNVYNQQAPRIQGISNTVEGLLPGMIDRYTNGSETSNIAKNYSSGIMAGQGAISYNGDSNLNNIINAQSYYTPNSHLSDVLGTESTYKPSSYFQTLMSGDANQNASLDAMVGLTRNNIYDTMAARGGTRGLTGGSHLADIVGRGMADAETGLRYQDYTYQTGRMDDAAKLETGRMDTADQSLAARQDAAAQFESGRSDSANQFTRGQAATAAEAEAARKLDAQKAAADQKAQAAALAAQLASLENQQAGTILDTATVAAGMPLDAASQYAGGVSGILGPYATNTTKESGGFLGGLLGTLGGAAIGKWSDARLKRDIQRVGQTDAGLPIYTYRYAGQDDVQMGVMAQDVAWMQPEALGASVAGYATVHYGEIR